MATDGATRFDEVSEADLIDQGIPIDPEEVNQDRSDSSRSGRPVVDDANLADVREQLEPLSRSSDEDLYPHDVGR
jgi:hypothetical protein